MAADDARLRRLHFLSPPGGAHHTAPPPPHGGRYPVHIHLADPFRPDLLSKRGRGRLFVLHPPRRATPLHTTRRALYLECRPPGAPCRGAYALLNGGVAWCGGGRAPLCRPSSPHGGSARDCTGTPRDYGDGRKAVQLSAEAALRVPPRRTHTSRTRKRSAALLHSNGCSGSASSAWPGSRRVALPNGRRKGGREGCCVMDRRLPR